MKHSSSSILDIVLLLDLMICVLLKSILSLMNWFLFFPRYALSFSIDKTPDKYFLNFSISMKWCECSVLFVSAFFLFHVKFYIDPLHKWIVPPWTLEKKCFWCDFIDFFMLSVNIFIMMSSSINTLDMKHKGLQSHMPSCLIRKYNLWYTVSFDLKMLRNHYQI